ncbi:MAG: hypothetical protein V4681_00640 [Patescibacteria group bacterium]
MTDTLDELSPAKRQEVEEALIGFACELQTSEGQEFVWLMREIKRRGEALDAKLAKPDTFPTSLSSLTSEEEGLMGLS